MMPVKDLAFVAPPPASIYERALNKELSCCGTLSVVRRLTARTVIVVAGVLCAPFSIPTNPDKGLATGVAVMSWIMEEHRA